MKSKTIYGLVFFGFMALAPIALYAQSGAGPNIGLLNNTTLRYFDGAGSPQIWPQGRARYGMEGYFYMLPSNSGDGAVMNLNGSVVRLREAGTNRPRKLRRGTKFYEDYSGSGFSVRVNYTVVKNIEHEDGSTTTYRATVTVRKGGSSRTVTGLSESGF